MTALKLIDAIMGKGPLKVPGSSLPKDIGHKTQVEFVLANCLISGILREDFHFTPYNTISYICPGKTQLRKPFLLSLPVIQGLKRKKTKAKLAAKTDVIHLTDSE